MKSQAKVTAPAKSALDEIDAKIQPIGPQPDLRAEAAGSARRLSRAVGEMLVDADRGKSGNGNTFFFRRDFLGTPGLRQTDGGFLFGQHFAEPALRHLQPVWLKLGLIVYLLERDAEPVLFPPYDAAPPARLTGLHDQLEFVGNGQGMRHVKVRAGIRQISDRTTVRAAVEFDRRAF